ncbi:cupin [Helicobacter cholecystus]|uniref:Cupin n=1 Tax=Helicobacter cholecystus TaxID=45498 RepID=A0A3D8IW32_9HELI|nr:cupin [Helicobacter cholecystus]RDU69487.1 cupin [Helicobacter cholecystus]VEJ24038.1 cupin [Helicobacter cholecystus]
MQVLDWSKVDFTQGVKITPMKENQSVKEILITLPKEGVLSEHKAPYNIGVQVLSGEIEFGVQGEVLVLKALENIYLDTGVLHHLKGLKDSIVRLSLYKV